MFHNTLHKRFIIFCTVIILCILYTYGLFHTIFNFNTLGMYVRNVVRDFLIYINSRFQLTVSCMCMHFNL
jgi:hypothetical protein